MPDRNNSGSLAGALNSDDDFEHVLYEKAYQKTECDHSLEFWVAVETRQRELPVVVQWCMRCNASEILTLEEYQIRRISREKRSADGLTDHLDQSQREPGV